MKRVYFVEDTGSRPGMIYAVFNDLDDATFLLTRFHTVRALLFMNVLSFTASRL